MMALIRDLQRQIDELMSFRRRWATLEKLEDEVQELKKRVKKLEDESTGQDIPNAWLEKLTRVAERLEGLVT